MSVQERKESVSRILNLMINECHLPTDDYEEDTWIKSEVELEKGEYCLVVEYSYKTNIYNYSPQTYWHPEEYDSEVELEIEDITFYDEEGDEIEITNEEYSNFKKKLENNDV